MTAQPMASLLTGVIPEGFSATPFDGEAATLALLIGNWIFRGIGSGRGLADAFEPDYQQHPTSNNTTTTK